MDFAGTWNSLETGVLGMCDRNLEHEMISNIADIEKDLESEVNIKVVSFSLKLARCRYPKKVDL